MSETSEAKGHLIDGAWRVGEKREDLEQKTAPFSGQVVWQGSYADTLLVDAALISSRQALYSWKKSSQKERYALLTKLQKALEEREQDLAEAIAIDTGKVMWEAKSEVKEALAKLSHTMQAQKERQAPIHQGKEQLQFHPHGLLAIFGPFNFPLHLSHGQIIPALLAGNCVLFKPSPLAPLTAQLYGEALLASGLPKGVVNILFGDVETAKAIANHRQIDGLLFTGSAEVGLELASNFAKTPQKILALEMGGSNPLIVSHHGQTRGAALSKEAQQQHGKRSETIYKTILSAFITTGQRCSCARRLILVRSAVDNLWLKDLVEAVKKLPIGAPFEQPAPFMGPLISKKAQRHFLSFQRRLFDQGGKALLEGTILQERAQGHWVSPAIIKMPSEKMISDQECFGPILQVTFAGDLQEAIDLANETPYGLSASILTDREEEFALASLRLRAGCINWNEPTTGASARLPFGGIGLSGNHRPGGYYMIDSCAYPVASRIEPDLSARSTPLPGTETLFIEGESQ